MKERCFVSVFTQFFDLSITYIIFIWKTTHIFMYARMIIATRKRAHIEVMSMAFAGKIKHGRERHESNKTKIKSKHL